MKLRDHPRLSFKGLSSWPPAWIWRSGKKYRRAEGEIGTLKDVMLSGIEPCQTCFLIMHHERQEYVGVLLIEDVLTAGKSTQCSLNISASPFTKLAISI
jgi:hypothetical protein